MHFDYSHPKTNILLVNHPETEEENILLNRIAGGDENAFRKLFNTYVDKLSFFVMGWTKNTELTEEIVQDVFLKLWMNRKSLSEIKNFDGYLYVACRNQCYTALKKLLNERSKAAIWENSLTDNTVILPEDEEDIYFDHLEEVVRQLPPRQKEVFQLKMRNQLKYSEIGESLGISPETARKHLNAALKSIKSSLNKNITLFLIFSKFF